MRHPNPIVNAVAPVIETVFIGTLWVMLSPIHVANLILRLMGRQGSA